MITRERVEKYQIGVYAVALLVGAGIGLASPAIGGLFGHVISVLIAILLYSMFSQIPFLHLRDVFTNGRFIGCLLIVNFAVAPVVVFALTSIFPQPSEVMIGVYLVLLTPCIDYVIVFTQLGKGNEKLMLAATPILFVVQMILLPVYLWMFMGPAAADIVRIGPFVEAFFFLIAIPLIVALAAQYWARKRAWGTKALAVSAWLPVPFMALVLVAVVASQIARIREDFGIVAAVIPIYILFHIVMPLIARVFSSVFRLDSQEGRAAIFSAGTRNSLVVLPLALTLPEEAAMIAAAVIVTQTVVELVAELAYIRVVPGLLYREPIEKESVRMG